MRILLNYKLLFILPFLFAACKTDKHVVDATYFGGKIVNPKSSHVLFYKGEKLLDSANLSEKNRFMFKFDDIDEGLYSFFHGNEYQFIFLKPYDSLLLRLNTWDFDESLVFSGTGAERNNLLINLFLINEKENKSFYEYYKLEHDKFEQVIDSLKQIKQALFTEFKNDNAVTPLYEKYTNALIEFPLYRKKEAYPHLHKRALALADYPKLTKDFYNYRNAINYNDEDLATFYVYREYMRTHLNHISYEKYLTEGKEKPMPLYFLKEVSQTVKNDELRNNLLDEAMWNLCVSSDLTAENLSEAKNIFFEKCSDKKIVSTINSLMKAKEALPKNTKLPELIIYNNSFNKIRLNDVIKGHNSVVYFWPKKERQVENLSKRVKYLEKQHPNLLFVGINSKFPTKNWNGFLKKQQFNAKNQFLLDKEVRNDWLHFDFSRTILVSKDGTVSNGFTHLNTRNFEDQLKALE